MADKFDDATQVSPLLTIPRRILTSVQKEIQTFLEQEQAHSRVQTAVHKLTGMCWDKYVYPLL